MSAQLTAGLAPLLQHVPIVATLGIELVDLDTRSATLRLPDGARFRNHLGGPHAGGMFTLAETAAGILIFANFAEYLDRFTPLIASATIRYGRIAMGPVTAISRLDRDPADIAADLDQGLRPEWPVEVELSTGNGTLTGSMTANMTLRPNR